MAFAVANNKTDGELLLAKPLMKFN